MFCLPETLNIKNIKGRGETKLAVSCRTSHYKCLEQEQTAKKKIIYLTGWHKKISRIFDHGARPDNVRVESLSRYKFSKELVCFDP